MAENKPVDLNCIKIDINGLPNSNTNKRCTNNNIANDGFVYNSSTITEDDGITYKYNYEVKDESDSIVTINGNNDKYRNSSYIRNKTGSESIINAANVWNSKEQFNGKTTKTFVYNEGNSSNLGNGENNYISNSSDAFSDQIAAVRNL